MKIEQSFGITFKTNKYPKIDKSINQDGVITDKVEKIDIELNLTETDAANFLFKFTPNGFKIGEYNVLITFDGYHKLKNIVLNKEDYIYIVYNMNQVISQIHEGYFRLITMNKINSILEFDFNIDEDEEIHEEFEEE